MTPGSRTSTGAELSGDVTRPADDARGEVLDVCRQMVSSGLVLGTAGNVSVRVADGRILSTPSGVAYDTMRAGDLPLVDLETAEWEGPLKPTSEIPLHTGILSAREDVHAIVHTHSRHAAAFSVARLDIPFLANESLAMHAERILVTRYAPPGTQGLADATLEALAKQPGSRAVLLANHGVVAVAHDLASAFLVAAQVEWIAEVYYMARQLGGAHILAREHQFAMGRNYGVRLFGDDSEGRDA